MAMATAILGLSNSGASFQAPCGHPFCEAPGRPCSVQGMGGLSVYRWKRGQWLVCLRERSRVPVGPRGAGGRKPSSQLGIQSLKESTSQALGLHILAMRMNANMVIFPLKFEDWIR